MEVWISESHTVQVAADSSTHGGSTQHVNLIAEKTWKVLNDAIHEINNHNASGLSFEELYRQVLHKPQWSSCFAYIAVLMSIKLQECIQHGHQQIWRSAI